MVALAAIGACSADEAPNQQSRADELDHRQRNVGNDERIFS
jgi:hypothetical protein